MENEQSRMNPAARLPDSYYYGIWPTISKVVAEMDDMSVDYPSQRMFEPMLDRVYDEVTKMYPENGTEQYQQYENNSDSSTEQIFRRPFRRRMLFRDLLAVLLLRELLDRRRRW